MRETSQIKYLLHQCVHDGLGDHINHCTLHDVEVGGNEQLCEKGLVYNFYRLILQGDLLITSTSVDSRSDRLAEALRVGGGASMAAIFFLFLEAQKLPKNQLPLGDSPVVSREGL